MRKIFAFFREKGAKVSKPHERILGPPPKIADFFEAKKDSAVENLI
jgi:hypothetical protein